MRTATINAATLIGNRLTRVSGSLGLVNRAVAQAEGQSDEREVQAGAGPVDGALRMREAQVTLQFEAETGGQFDERADVVRPEDLHRLAVGKMSGGIRWFL